MTEFIEIAWPVGVALGLIATGLLTDGDLGNPTMLGVALSIAWPAVLAVSVFFALLALPVWLGRRMRGYLWNK